MSDESLIEALYAQAARIVDPKRRSEHLQSACGSDEELRRRVEALLATHSDSRALDHSFGPRDERGPVAGAEKPGDRIGPYLLRERIGEGGFGAVFSADQTEPIRRRVALKVLKPGMDAGQIVRRFEQERHTLALMDHPHVARVLDAGTSSTGHPYFVMELVEGEAITSYCDRSGASIPDRLRLFILVCRAVHHAHQKGVIHRDLKPSNILVTGRDADAAPKIIDFGIAKAVTRENGAASAAQTLWHQFLGTPAYMSPEQTRPGELDVDTRSDIYSLGVLLHELLTGVLPVELSSVHDPDEARRRIREEPVRKPSTRFDRLDPAQQLDLAGRRSVKPAELRGALRGDLDWVVLRATEKERSRRYESAEALARDVERFLEHEPIEARPQSVAYLCGRFIRRHRVLAGATVVVVVAMTAGLISAGWGWHVATRESAIARAENLKAQQMNDILFRGLLRADPGQEGGRDYTVRQLLDDLGRDLESGANLAPDVERALCDMLAFIYWQTGDYEPALRHGLRGLRVAGAINEDPNRLASLHMTVGEVYKEQGRYLDAARHLEACLELRRTAFGAVHPQVNRTMLSVARVRYNSGERDAALELCALALAESRLHAAGAWGNTPLIRCLNMMEILLKDEGRLEDAVELNRERLELVRKEDGEHHPETVRTRAQFGELLFTMNRLDEAEEMLAMALTDARASLGPDYPVTLEIMMALARCQARRGESVAAAALFDEALRRSAAAFEGEYPDRRDWLLIVAEFHERSGNLRRADELRAELTDGVALE